jgi:hypothetical protein
MDLETSILAQELAIRLGFFVGIFGVVAAWEVLAPRRALTVAKGLRWTANLGPVGLNTVLLRLALPLAAVGMAAFASAHGWGLLNHFAVPLNATAMFNHGNIRLPGSLDRWLRWIVVTPDMHLLTRHHKE